MADQSGDAGIWPPPLVYGPGHVRTPAEFDREISLGRALQSLGIIIEPYTYQGTARVIIEAWRAVIAQRATEPTKADLGRQQRPLWCGNCGADDLHHAGGGGVALHWRCGSCGAQQPV